MSEAQLKITESNGLSNSEWLARKNDAVARAQGSLAPVFVERALGSEIWDVEGKRYIDFGTGIAVCSAGHSHPKITAAVIKKALKVLIDDLRDSTGESAEKELKNLQDQDKAIKAIEKRIKDDKATLKAKTNELDLKLQLKRLGGDEFKAESQELIR